MMTTCKLYNLSCGGASNPGCRGVSANQSGGCKIQQNVNEQTENRNSMLLAEYVGGGPKDTVFLVFSDNLI